MAAAELAGRATPAPVRAAQELLEVRGRVVRLRYTPVDEMSVSGIGMDHQTGCILYK